MTWFFAVLFAGLAALPAAAQPSDSCRITCGAQMNPVPPALRQCLARCAAGEAFSQRNPEPPPAQQAPAMLAPPAPAAAPPAAAPVIVAPPVVAVPPLATTREPAPIVEAPRPAPPATAAPASGPPAGVAPPPPPVTYGAFSLAVLPRMEHGISVGQRDRSSAQRAAELSCRASGASCAPVLDFAEPCIAVAEGVRRAPQAMFITSDPRSYRVFAVTHGVANNPADAGRIAVEACVARDRTLTCRVAEAACGPR